MKAKKWSDELMNYVPWNDMTLKEVDRIKTVMRKHKPLFECGWSLDQEVEELRYYGGFKGIKRGSVDTCLNAAEKVDFDDVKALVRLYHKFRKARVSEGGYCTNTETKIRDAIRSLKAKNRRTALEALKTECRELLREDRVREIRLKLGLNMDEMSTRLGMNRSYYSAIENGKVNHSEKLYDCLTELIKGLNYNDLQE